MALVLPSEVATLRQYSVSFISLAAISFKLFTVLDNPCD